MGLRTSLLGFCSPSSSRSPETQRGRRGPLTAAPPLAPADREEASEPATANKLGRIKQGAPGTCRARAAPLGGTLTRLAPEGPGLTKPPSLWGETPFLPIAGGGAWARGFPGKRVCGPCSSPDPTSAHLRPGWFCGSPSIRLLNWAAHLDFFSPLSSGPGPRLLVKAG